MGIFPKYRGEHKKCLKPPTRPSFAFELVPILQATLRGMYIRQSLEVKTRTLEPIPPGRHKVLLSQSFCELMLKWLKYGGSNPSTRIPVANDGLVRDSPFWTCTIILVGDEPASWVAGRSKGYGFWFECQGKSHTFWVAPKWYKRDNFVHKIFVWRTSAGYFGERKETYFLTCPSKMHVFFQISFRSLVVFCL